MQHDSIFRCIAPACGRTLPRSVNFCPYCGTAQAGAQADAARQEAAAAPPVPAGFAKSEGAPQAAAASPAAPAAAAGMAAGAAGAPARDAAHLTPPPPAAPTPAPGWGEAPAASASAHGPAAGNTRPLPPAPPPPPPPPPSAARPYAAGAGPAPAPPPKREPVRLHWWILALAALWAIWLLAKPSTRRIEAQMDKAIALARDCHPRDAQTELIALRKTEATAEQLQQVQRALNDAAGMCTRKRQRDKAWREAKSGVESALSGGAAERARQRLRTFTKRWGEDDETRALKAEIDERAPEHPRADEVEGGMTR